MKEVTGNSIQPVLAYSLFMLNVLSTNPLSSGIDFKKIWKNQCLDDLLSSEFDRTVIFVQDYFENYISGTEKTILSVSKNAGFFEGFKAKVESQSMKGFLSDEYRKSLVTRDFFA